MRGVETIVAKLNEKEGERVERDGRRRWDNDDESRGEDKRDVMVGGETLKDEDVVGSQRRGGRKQSQRRRDVGGLVRRKAKEFTVLFFRKKR